MGDRKASETFSLFVYNHFFTNNRAGYGQMGFIGDADLRGGNHGSGYEAAAEEGGAAVMGKKLYKGLRPAFYPVEPGHVVCDDSVSGAVLRPDYLCV